MNNSANPQPPPVQWFDTPLYEGLWWIHLARDGQERTEIARATQLHDGNWFVVVPGDMRPLYVKAIREQWAEVRFTPALTPRMVTNTAPPTREEVERHLQAHGGFWQVSRVRHGDEWRPMVLLVSSDRDWLHASIPGVDFGAKWDDDPFRFMEGAEWTPLTREGRRLHRLAA